MQKEALFYKNLRNKKVKCNLCWHNCELTNGSLGKCRVRKNDKGILQTLVYGFPVVENVDPVEKKPFFHFLPGSLTYSVGTLGCNFFCQNCQNWELSQARFVEKKIKEMNFTPPEKIVEAAIGNGCDSISYTYNEPTVFAEYALEIMELAHKNGLKNLWVSNGYMSSELLAALSPFLDGINIDLKSFFEDFYQKICGASLSPVLKNLILIKQEQIHLEITTLVIPGLADSLEMFSLIVEFIANNLGVETPWHISKFSPEASWRLKEIPPTGDDLIYQAFETAKEAGLKYVYVGNMPGDQKENTYCPKCGELAIRRWGYHIERFDKNGHCAFCDYNLDIVD